MKRKHIWCLVNNSEGVVGQGIVTVYILLDKQRDWHATGVYALYRNKNPKDKHNNIQNYIHRVKKHTRILWTKDTLNLFPKNCVRNQQQSKNKNMANRGFKKKQNFWLFVSKYVCICMYTNQDVCVTIHLATLSAQCNSNNHCTWLDIPYTAMLTDSV